MATWSPASAATSFFTEPPPLPAEAPESTKAGKSVEELLTSAEAHRQRGEFDRAIAVATEAIQLNSGCARAFADRGLAHQGKKDYQRVIADFTEAIRLSPKTAEFYFRRAMAHFCLHIQSSSDECESPQYLRDLDEALKLDPDFLPAYVERAENREDICISDEEEADRLDPQCISDWTNVIRLRPDWWKGYACRAGVYQRRGDFEKAIEDCNRGLALPQESTKDGPSSLQLLLEQRAEAHELQDDPQKAIEDWTTLMAKEPDCTADCQKNIQRLRGEQQKQEEKAKAAKATKAVLHTASWPGMPTGHSDPDERPIFSGDGPCLKCKTMLWIDWRYSTDSMRCPQCGFTFDGEQSLTIVLGHEPEKGQGNVEIVRKMLKMKKQLVQQEAEEQQQRTVAKRQSSAEVDSEERERLEGLIRKWESLWLLASVGKDYQQAQMIQLRISEIRRHLDSL